MTKDETLRLALEALESGVKTQNGRLDWIEYDSELVEQAITAIKEALAQPEHDYKDLYEKEKRRSAMWLSKYEEVAGPAPKAIPMAQSEPVAFASHGVVNWIADKQFQHEAHLYSLPQRGL